jgi:hypothetical protein
LRFYFLRLNAKLLLPVVKLTRRIGPITSAKGVVRYAKPAQADSVFGSGKIRQPSILHGLFRNPGAVVVADGIWHLFDRISSDEYPN